MKLLRVIAGLHAGACLTLAPGRYRIDDGAHPASRRSELSDPAQATEAAESAVVQDAGSRLRLYDWTTAPLVLVVDGQGEIAAFHSTASTEPDAAMQAAPWPDLQPRRYGEVVLCSGDADRPWPSDAHLLGMLRVQASNGPAGPGWVRSWSARAVGVGTGLLVAVGALYGRSTGSPPVLPPPQPALGAQWLSRSLQSQGLHELEVRHDRRDVSLSGLVRDARQGQAVRMAVADVHHDTGIPVVESWQVAEEVASTIESALRAPGVHVRYLGTGRFEVAGTVADPAQLRNAAPQLQKDLGPNVRDIEFVLERIPKEALFSAAIAADALHYTQRPDGAKVFASRHP
ncbi:hypothetical protein GN316_15635 [Xylophilus sp. Kf1]|nr:hypothetical protein [Xylophilus sp. Kf1]